MPITGLAGIAGFSSSATGGSSPPTFVAAGTAGTGSNANSISPGYPAGIAANDILILTVMIRDNAGAATVSTIGDAGFTQFLRRTQRGDLYVYHYWKRATGSESGTTTITFSEVAEAGIQHSVIAAYRGCKATGTPYEGLTARLQDSTTAVVGPNILTNDVNRLAVSYCVQPDISVAGANDGSWIEDFEAATATGEDANISGSSISASVAGLVAANTRTMGSSAVAYTTGFALLPIGAADPSANSISVRGSRISYVNNANSLTFTLPASSAEGDWCIIFAGHGFGVNTPTGWNLQESQTGTNWNGAYFEKELSASDISTGTLSITFTGAYYGIVAGISFTKKPGYIAYYGSSRNSAGAASRALTTNEPLIATGDYVVTFGSGRYNGTVTCDTGSSLQSSSNLNASGALYGGSRGSSGNFTTTVSYGGGTPTGDFQAVIVMTP